MQKTAGIMAAVLFLIVVQVDAEPIALHPANPHYFIFKMSPDKGFIAGGVPSGEYYRGMSQPGHQYALYLHHSKGGRGSAYTVTPGNYTDRLVLKLPAGTYQVDWVAPETGSVIRTDTSTHKGGYRTVETPAYSVDIALRIKRVS